MAERGDYGAPYPDRQLSQLARTIAVMRKYATDPAVGAGADDLADQYEVLILYSLPVPADLDQKLREAHRRVHLRGLDPLRKTT
jgi:hypothetical protein